MAVVNFLMVGMLGPSLLEKVLVTRWRLGKLLMARLSVNMPVMTAAGVAKILC